MLKEFSNHISALEESIDDYFDIENNINYAHRINLRFKLRNDLIYYINFNDGREKLYISETLKTYIFHLAHDMQHYKNYH